MRRIIVATDGSPGANRAIEIAAMLAKTSGADLIILTIGGNITGAQLRELADAAGDLSKTLEAAAKRILGHGPKARASYWCSQHQAANRMGRPGTNHN